MAWAARCCAMPRSWFDFRISIRVSNGIFLEFFVRVSSCSRNEPFDYRGSTLCRYCCCCVVVVVAAAAAAVDIRPYVGVEAGKIFVSSLRYAFSEFVHVHLLDHRRVALQFSAGPRYFHHRQNVQIGSEVHPGSYNNGYRGWSSQGVKLTAGHLLSWLSMGRSIISHPAYARGKIYL